MANGWGSKIGLARVIARLGVVLTLGSLTAACFQPLYSRESVPAGDSVRDKMAAVEIVKIPARNGTPDARLAVALRNALMFNLNNGAEPSLPTHQLQVTLTSGVITVIVDVSSGRPDTQVESLNATFTLTEIATKKVVLTASTFARASFDIPGSAQRFARQRAWRNAEDRAVELISDNIRNRLASFFVAGT
jgi:LPS-assembly lipoprotein